MSLLVLFLVTSAVFLIADGIVLGRVIQPIFARYLGDALYPDGFRKLPAVLFYLTYTGGLIWFVSWPALQSGTPEQAALNGAILGLVAFGTYEFTSWAVMRDWHPNIVMADLTWGVLMTAGTAWAGVTITRAIMG